LVAILAKVAKVLCIIQQVIQILLQK